MMRKLRILPKVKLLLEAISAIVVAAMLLLFSGCAAPPSESPSPSSEIPPQYANDPIYKALNAAKSAPPSIEGKRVAATLANGRKVGDLELCTTTLEQAVAMFPPAPTPAYVGNPRPPQGYPPVTVGAVHHRPESVFNPWGSQYGLYFNSDKRLIIVQVLLAGATTIDYFTGKYPQLKDTARTADAVEMQGAIDSCIAVMTLSAPTDGHVDQLAYACTCEAK